MKMMNYSRNPIKHVWLAITVVVFLFAAGRQGAFGQTNTFPSSGNVGIGTTTPNGGSLQIQSATADNHIYVSSVAPDIVFGNNSTRASATAIGYIGLATSTNHFATGSAAGELIMGTSQSNKVHITTNGSIRMSVDGSGNVGIGTASPAVPLHVSSASLGQRITFTDTSSFGGLVIYEGSTQKANFTFTGSASGSSYIGGANALQIWNASGPIIIGTNGTERLRIDGSGNVGIGTTSPASGYKLDVNGHANVTGNLNVTGNIAAKYQDVAEWVPSSEQVPAGTVVVLDSTKSNQVVSSSEAYDTRVAGVVSEQPGIALGESGQGKVLVATTGRVLVKVDASRGPIHIGDLLVTSDVPGLAMKSAPVNLGDVQLHRPGTLIGKALEPLEKGSGKILVLLSLQ
jgi:hypothetical protein